MNVGLIVEGDAEFHALPLVLPSLRDATGHAIRRPIKATIHPTASPAAIARVCQPYIALLRSKGDDLIILMLDMETDPSCPGDRAAQVERAILSRSGIAVKAVLKNRMFENWLVSDLDAFAGQRARFRLSAAMRRAVEPNHADQIDALEWLKRACLGASYAKVEDAKRILGRADPLRMATNSRSFRRLLRVADHPAYARQSKRPA